MLLYLLSFLLSFSAFSQVFIGHNERGLNFRMEKLDEQSASRWAAYAEEGLRQNQNFLETLGYYNAEFTKADELTKKYNLSASELQLTPEEIFNRAFPEGSPFRVYAQTKLAGDRVAKATPLRAFHIGLYDGLSNFSKVVRSFKTLNKDNTDVWVAYIVQGNTVLLEPFDKTTNLEMAMAVMIPRDLPITIHMGISRNLQNVVFGKSSPQISTELHGFAAKVAQMLHPTENRAMVTTPSEAMCSILIKAGLPEGDIAVGRNSEKARVFEHGYSWDEDYSFRVKAKNLQSDIVSLNQQTWRESIGKLHINDPTVVDLVDLQKLFTFTVESI